MEFTQEEKLLAVKALTDMSGNPKRSPQERMMAGNLADKMLLDACSIRNYANEEA